MKKRLMTLALAAALVWGCVTEAKAIEFRASGEWLMGFGANESTFQQDGNGGGGTDVFKAAQRVALQLDAVASEYLSGTIAFEIGTSNWGQNGNDSGAALGADQTIITMTNAYLDWFVPNTELQFRMGVFGVALPNAAGGSTILDDDVAGVAVNYPFNDNVGLTVAWLRPWNDNYTNDSVAVAGATKANYDPDNYLDNVDLFTVSLPMSFDGFEVTPWVLYGMIGQNSVFGNGSADAAALLPHRFNANGDMGRDSAYGSVFFAGLPVIISAADPWNIEFDINYGSVSGFDEYSLTSNRAGAVAENAGSNRSGWVIKGLVEYQMDWGRPGLFAWYGTGDDGEVDNGSERMPTVSPAGNFTSFGYDGYGWGDMGESGILGNHYAGTWGIGLQLSEFSFTEDLSHTLRIAYIGGTNSPDMMDYFDDNAALGWSDPRYLTTQDYLVEINFDSVYSIYENLNAIFEIGYIFNGFDTDEWNKAANGSSGNWNGKGDAWKVDIIFEYSF